MKQDTRDFLATLLWLASDNDGDTDDAADSRLLADKTIDDFSDAFIGAAEAFIDAFRADLDAVGFAAWDIMERSFGGNVYLSLSGHGAGFFDDSCDGVAALHDALKKWAGDGRFEGLDSLLCVGDDGRIDLALVPEAIEERRKELFRIPGKDA